jgi:hypothetical protein
MQNKNWIKIHEKLPSVNWLDENVCEVENVRNLKYKLTDQNSEFEPSEILWGSEKYDLRNLKDVWLVENNYAKFQSHIMLSFELIENDKSEFLTVSAEVRKTGGANFEIWYVLYFGKEEDLIFLRTNFRKSGVYLYKLNLDKNESVNLFKEISKNTNSISKGVNVIYKLFKTDCVNTMLLNFTNAGIKVKKYFWDYSPTTVLWRSGLIKNEVLENGENKFKNLKDVFKKTEINIENDKIKKLKQSSEFSSEIRKML